MTDPAARPARAAPGTEPSAEHYRPLTRRRRLLIVALAVATAVAVILTLLDPPGGVQRPRGPEAGGRAEAASRSEPGVGGKVDVLPPARPASR